MSSFLSALGAGLSTFGSLAARQQEQERRAKEDMDRLKAQIEARRQAELDAREARRADITADRDARLANAKELATLNHDFRLDEIKARAPRSSGLMDDAMPRLKWIDGGYAAWDKDSKQWVRQTAVDPSKPEPSQLPASQLPIGAPGATSPPGAIEIDIPQPGLMSQPGQPPAPTPAGRPGSSKDNPVDVTNRQEAASLPPGTWIRTPDGRIGQR